MTLKYKVGDVVVLAENVDQNYRKTFVPGVAVKIDQLCDHNSDDEHYTVKLVSDPSDYWYIMDNEINHEATETLQMSNESGYIVQKISVENDVVSSAVNTYDNKETAMKFKVGDKVEYVGEGWGETFERDVAYPVTEIWEGGCDVDGCPVSSLFYNDFKLVKDVPKAQDNSWYEKGELPPVGANIEYRLGGGIWFPAVVKYVLNTFVKVEGEVVVYCPHLKCEMLLVLDEDTSIRPIKSPEQIAAEEQRSAYCDRIYAVLCKAERKNNSSDMAEALYDAGLRFVEEE